MSKHKVFISYHHANDQAYKEALSHYGLINDIFTDMSVGVGDISDELSDQAIRRKIRDEYLRDSSVTILLVGTETKKRKHIDWEIYSSMIDGALNKRSGFIVVNLHPVSDTYITAAHNNEKMAIHGKISSWINIADRSEYERRYPNLPDRIIDNLLHSKAKISVVNWNHITASPQSLALLIENAYSHREKNEYDLSRPMRRRDG